MSKIKFLIATFVFALVALGGVSFADAACSDLAPARVGSRGANVQEIQRIVVAGMDGIFGNMTAAAVKAYQVNNGLSADGIVGPNTLAVMAAQCAGTTTTVVTTTDGCQAGWLVNPMTGVACGSTTTTTTVTLTGDAGDLSISTSTRGVENTVKEGEEEIVLGYKVKALDSNINITTLKVWMQNDGTAGDSSEALADYIKEVVVYLGDKEVGSVDADDFSRDRGTWDEFTSSINLSGAVVEKGETEYLYVAVVANSSIDTEDASADWDIEATSIRFTDGTGAILSDSDLGEETFGFSDESEDAIEIDDSKANPDESTIKVEEDDESDEVLVFAFNLEVDEDSSDISIFELPIDITIGSNDVSLTTIEDVIYSVMVKIDGKEIEADLDDSSDFTGATGTATYYVEFDEDEMVIDADDSVEVKVYVTFAEQGGADEDAIYSSGTTVTLSVDGGDIDAEGEDGEDVTVEGSESSETHSLSTASAIIDSYSWSVPSTGTYIDFYFTVEAEDDDFDVLLADVDYDERDGGTATLGTPTLSKYSGTAEAITGGFMVEDGDTAKFRARFNVYGDEGQWTEIIMNSVSDQSVPEDKEISPTATLTLDNAEPVV